MLLVGKWWAKIKKGGASCPAPIKESNYFFVRSYVLMIALKPAF